MNKFFHAIGGRKFFGFIIATVLLWVKLIPPEIWLAAFLIYSGSNIYQDHLRFKAK